MNPIEEFRDELTRRFPGIAAEIDPPADPRGPWYLDVRQEGSPSVVVEWRPGRGFGISTPSPDDYGTGPDEVHSNASVALARVDEVIRSGRPLDASRPIRLAELRQLRGLSQAELAERAGVRQANISRIESRGDLMVSTLSRLAEAMGASLSIRVRFPDGKDCELKV